MNNLSPLVVLTRPQGLADELSLELRQAGAAVDEWPALAIERLASGFSKVSALGTHDLTVVVSPSAAQRFIEQCESIGLLSWPKACVIATPGAATAKALTRLSRDLGFDAETLVCPPLEQVGDAKALFEHLLKHAPSLLRPGRRALLIRGEGGSPWLGDTLRASGVLVEIAEVYRRVFATLQPEKAAYWAQGLGAGRPFLWSVTSTDIACSLTQALSGWPEPERTQAMQQTVIAQHPRIVEVLRGLGWKRVGLVPLEGTAIIQCVQALRISDNIPPEFLSLNRSQA